MTRSKMNTLPLWGGDDTLILKLLFEGEIKRHDTLITNTMRYIVLEFDNLNCRFDAYYSKELPDTIGFATIIIDLRERMFTEGGEVWEDIN